jgi:hypothetical protein
MEDNRFDCHELCNSTHDLNNKCDGNCIGVVPNREERWQRAQEHNE